MELLFLIVSIIAFAAGILLVFAPKLLIKAGDVLNRIVTTDEVILSKRLPFGVLLIIIGVYLIYRYFQII